MKARVIVTLKAGVLDPQGQAIESALAGLGIEGILGVRQGKVFDLDIDPTLDRDTALARVRESCERLIANTVIETYRVELG